MTILRRAFVRFEASAQAWSVACRHGGVSKTAFRAMPFDARHRQAGTPPAPITRYERRSLIFVGARYPH